MMILLGLALLLAPPAKSPPPRGKTPQLLVGRWVEEGLSGEWRITLASDGLAIKERHRKCMPGPDNTPCIPLKYEGSWEARERDLLLHLPGGAVERFRYLLKGRLLTLTQHGEKPLNFVYQLPQARGEERPKPLVGIWSDPKRTLSLREDGSYTDHDDDGEAKGAWRADGRHLTLAPATGVEPMTYGWRIKKGSLVLSDAMGRSRKLEGH